MPASAITGRREKHKEMGSKKTNERSRMREKKENRLYKKNCFEEKELKGWEKKRTS